MTRGLPLTQASLRRAIEAARRARFPIIRIQLDGAVLVDDQRDNETTNGTVSYRRHNKPALGPLGGSLDDFSSGSP